MSLANIPIAGFPTVEDQSLARASSETITKFGNLLPPVRLVGDGINCLIPPGAVQQVAKMLFLMADGQPVEVVPALTELTVHQVANFLGFTKGHINELLQDNILEYRWDGDQRLILRESLLQFEQEYRAGRAAMAEVTSLSQKMGLYND